MQDRFKVGIAAIGIFVSYFYYGILQEKVTRSKYGDHRNEDGTHGEKFTFALTLVGIQCLWNWIFAKGLLAVSRSEKEDKTHYGYHACSAVTYLLAMVSSNMALRWVPYPTQVIGKSAKPIPVMLLGVLIGRKSYSIQRYCFVMIIVAGVVLFMMKDGKTSSGAQGQSIGIGEILLVMSLSMDGLLGAIQERMRAAYSPTAKHIMLSINGWSSLILSICVVISGEIFEFIAFTNRYPYVLYQLALLALTGSLGQIFISTMVSSFGPLSCSIVTTTRKFFTVLCSVIFFGNPLSSKQWFGAFLVFAGLFADALFGKSAPKKDAKTEKLLSK